VGVLFCKGFFYTFFSLYYLSDAMALPSDKEHRHIVQRATWKRSGTFFPSDEDISSPPVEAGWMKNIFKRNNGPTIAPVATLDTQFVRSSSSEASPDPPRGVMNLDKRRPVVLGGLRAALVEDAEAERQPSSFMFDPPAAPSFMPIRRPVGLVNRKMTFRQASIFNDSCSDLRKARRTPVEEDPASPASHGW